MKKFTKAEKRILDEIKEKGWVCIFGNNDTDKIKVNTICGLAQMGFLKYSETVGVTDYFVFADGFKYE